MDLYCTAIGKLFLSQFSDYQLEDYFDKITPVAQTPRTIMTIDAMKEEIQKIKEQGFAIDDEEFFQNMRCIAYPIIGYDNRIVAGVSVTGIADEMTGEPFAAIKYDLSRICQRLSRKLGNQK